MSTITNGMVLDAIKFARETWRNDGAEGETVHLLCNTIEQMKALAGCSWCGQTVPNTPEAMTQHLLTCEERATSQEEVLRRAAGVAAALDAMIRDLLASAVPHPVDNPTMWSAWYRAERFLGIPDEKSQRIMTSDKALEARLTAEPMPPISDPK